MRIDTKTIFKGDDTNHTKLLSCVIFRMKHKYRNFYVYKNTLIELIKISKIKFKDWTLRIYLDDSIPDEVIDFFKSSNVEIVKYKCNEFWDEESKTHEGFFGSFMRYLPMFSAKKYEMVAFTDVDSKPLLLNHILWLSKNVEEFGCFAGSCPSSYTPHSKNFSMMGQAFLTKIVFQKRLLTDYLKKIKNGKITVDPLKETDIGTTYIPFGSDENFLNIYLINYIFKHKIKIIYKRITFIPSYINTIITPIKTEQRIIKIDKYIKKLYEYYNFMFYNGDIHKLDNKVFIPLLEKILPVIEDEFKRSFLYNCINEYIRDPKIVRIEKYNY